MCTEQLLFKASVCQNCLNITSSYSNVQRWKLTYPSSHRPLCVSFSFSWTRSQCEEALLCVMMSPFIQPLHSSNFFIYRLLSCTCTLGERMLDVSCFLNSCSPRKVVEEATFVIYFFIFVCFLRSQAMTESTVSTQSMHTALQTCGCVNIVLSVSWEREGHTKS